MQGRLSASGVDGRLHLRIDLTFRCGFRSTRRSGPKRDTPVSWLLRQALARLVDEDRRYSARCDRTPIVAIARNLRSPHLVTRQTA